MLETKKYPLAIAEYDNQRNILFLRVKQEQVVDVAEIKEMLANVKEFMGEKRHYAVIDFGSNLGSTTEARKVYAEDPFILKYRIADAFLVKSLSVRLIANFFIKVTKPKTTTRLFTSESDAIKWIEIISFSPINTK